MASGSKCAEWVVLLEVADDDGLGGIDRSGFSRLIESWADASPTTLYSPSRYVVQVSVKAATPALALSEALLRWKNALRRTRLPEGVLVRAELVTPDQLEREIAAGELPAVADAGPGPRPGRRPDAAEDDLLRRALHDGLTGMRSREIFLDDVRRALAPGVSSGPVYAMMAIDLDLGPVATDEVLLEMAGRLAGTVRRTDIVARAGDRRLAVFVAGSSVGEFEAVAGRILDRLGAPVIGCGSPLMVTASLGLVVTSPGDDPDVVLADAERAMGAARAAGGGCCLLPGASTRPRAQADGRSSR